MILSFLLLYLSSESVSGYGYMNSYNRPYVENHKYCDDLSPYFGDINLDQIAGVWYGVEKIHHAKGEYRIEYSKECFYVDIKELYIQVSFFVFIKTVFTGWDTSMYIVYYFWIICTLWYLS